MDLGPHSENKVYIPYGLVQTGKDTVTCAFLVVLEGQIVGENRFRLTDGAKVFAAEVIVIREANSNAHCQGLGEIDINSDSKSALFKVLCHNTEP